MRDDATLKVYFWNQATNETAWEPPASYWNQATNETSWEPPVSEAHGELGERRAAGNHGTVGEHHGSNGGEHRGGIAAANRGVDDCTDDTTYRRRATQAEHDAAAWAACEQVHQEQRESVDTGAAAPAHEAAARVEGAEAEASGMPSVSYDHSSSDAPRRQCSRKPRRGRSFGRRGVPTPANAGGA